MNQRTSSTRQSLLRDHYNHQEILDEVLRRWPGIEHDPELQREHLPAGLPLAELRRLAAAESITLEQFRAQYRVGHETHPHGTRFAYARRWVGGRRNRYDPWYDLSFRLQPHPLPYAPTILGIEWFSPAAHDDDLGHAVFNGRVIRLSVLLSETELRTTLTHELIHLERGRVPRHLGEAEEDAVELLTAQRLIDPDDFDAGATAQSLGVDQACRDRYAEWRRHVSAEEAATAWEVATWGMPRPNAELP